jgi:hypothetical protein
LSEASRHCTPLASTRHVWALVYMMAPQRRSRFCYICVHVYLWGLH